MRQLGLLSEPHDKVAHQVGHCEQPSKGYDKPVKRQICYQADMQESTQRAAAAAAAAAAAQGKTHTKTVTETRRFAGKDIQVGFPQHHALPASMPRAIQSPFTCHSCGNIGRCNMTALR